MSNNELIKLINVCKTFPGVKALDSVNFDIRKGEIHALVGENGAGKSTLIKIMAGVCPPDPQSVIEIEGKQLTNFSPLSSVQNGIAVTFQDFSLFSNLTVAENIAISGEIEEGSVILNWAKMKAIAKQAIQKIGLDVDITLPLGSLSLAKQQLVAIARALVYDAKIIILDEPTATLSKHEVEMLYKIVRDLKEKGTSVLYISHRLEEVFDLADRVTVLRDGKHMGTYMKEDLNRSKLISLMVGREIEYERISGKGEMSQEILLEVEDLSKEGNYKDINFVLHKGEILGITGLVGAGRTELCESFFGLLKPDKGNIIYEGKPVKIKNTVNALKKSIAFAPENRQTQGLVLRSTVEENINLVVLDKLRSRFGLIKNTARHEHAAKWIKDLNVKPGYPDMLASKLSGGNQQRVVIAKWLATGPKMLIIDEPTNGVDVGAKQEIHEILRHLADEGMGIIMISSELPEILAVSDRILVMKRGRIAATFDAAEATQEKIMEKSI